MNCELVLLVICMLAYVIVTDYMHIVSTLNVVYLLILCGDMSTFLGSYDVVKQHRLDILLLTLNITHCQINFFSSCSSASSID